MCVWRREKESEQREKEAREIQSKKENREGQRQTEIEPKVLRHALLRVWTSIWKRKPKGRQLLSE